MREITTHIHKQMVFEGGFKHLPHRNILKILFFIFILMSLSVQAQIGIGTENPDPSSILDLNPSANDRGLLIPRMTQSQRNAIVSPANGLLIFQTDVSDGFYFYSGTSPSGTWKKIGLLTEYESNQILINSNTSSITANTSSINANTTSVTNSVPYTGATKSINIGTNSLTIGGHLKVSQQVGIGTTTPNASAKLDVVSSDKGFLPPRVALTATNVFAPVTGLSGSTELATAAGLLIYNTATNGSAPNNVTPGYYFWNGTTWVQIAGGVVIDTSKSSSFSISATDNNKLFVISATSNVTVTVPNSLPVGFSCQIIQENTGVITVAGGTGVSLNSSNGLKTRSRYSTIGIVMVSSSVGYVFGDTMY